MRLLRLHLKAVGPFTETALDLSAGDHGLHLIFGANEAGKTSVLRSLSHLLFGFPNRTPDDFLHPYDQLRVGAELRHSDGEVMEVVRRKGNKNTLRGADDAAVIAPGRLERFLGGVDQDTFESLFGIDHARLARAGEEIRTGQGRLGEILFAAGTGLTGLREAQGRLQAKLDDLFKPRGQNQRINQALAEYREAQLILKQSQLPCDEWQEHDRAFAAAQERAGALEEKILAARRDLGRLVRIRGAVPLIARRRRLRGDLGGLGAAIRLRESFGAESREAQDALHLALRTIEQAGAALGEIDGRLVEIGGRPPLLDAEDEIEALKETLGAVEKGLKDRLRLDGWRSEREHQAGEILRKLGRPPDLDAAEALRLRADEPTIVRSLGQQSTALRVRRDEARQAIARHEEQVDRLGRERDALGDPRDVKALRRAVREARKAGDLDAQDAQARAEADRAARKAGRALDRLPGWSGGLDDLERLGVPPEPTVDRVEADWKEADRDLRNLDSRRGAEDEAIRQLAAQLQALGLQQDVPTEDDLHTARRRRDEGWRLVRADWLGDGGEPAALASFLDEFAPARPLADAFEQANDRADAVADRLRREAERVTRKAEWLAQLDGRRAARDALDRAHAAASDRLERLREGWAALVGPLGVAAPGPAELRAWLRLRATVVQDADLARTAREASASVARARDAQRAALALALTGLGEAAPAADEGLAALLEEAEAVLEREARAVQGRSSRENQGVEARADLARERLRLRATEDELAAWRIDWAARMARLGIEPDAAPEQAEVILTENQALFETLGKFRDHRSRIRGIDRDAEEFAAAVADLARRVAPDLEGESAAERARALARRLQEARSVEQQRATLSEQREREAGRLAEAEAGRDDVAARLGRLCREAGCDTPDDLAEVERRSRDRARLEDDLRTTEDQILANAAGAGLEEFAAEVERADLDGLEPAAARLEGEIAGLENELHAVKEAVGAERVELARMDGGDRAAEAAEKAQTVFARLQADVATYARLKLASSVLNRGIERYREKSQGPVLERASRLFAGLTDGSFDRLQIDDDGEGRAVLKGVRADGRLIGVEGMSDGSHDQLYLALRLASLESWLQAHEPIPFVVDDILVNFDDRRALAALRALADLSERTQVLFFTHHAHLVELARAHLPPSVVFVRRLPPTPDEA